jgi:N-acetylneuraminic acid mutarotase
MRKFYSALLLSLLILSAQAGPWTQMASMGGLGRHRAFSFSIGSHGYVGGGWNSNVFYYDMWEYDPATNSWAQKANLPTYMWSDPAFGIGNKGYVVEGGYTYMYSPLSNTWNIVNFSSPSATYYDQLKFTINGKGYICDGYAIWEFNPQTNNWTSVYTISFPFYGDLGFAANNKGYFVDVYYNTCFEFDPASVSVVMKTPMPASNSQATSFGVNGKGYVGLGQVGIDDVREFYEYDPLTDSWRGINRMEGDARENATAFTIGNTAYVACGTNGINHNDLWQFDNTKVTGIADKQDANVFSVFPNPSVDGKFFVKQEGSELKNMSAQIFDATGKLLRVEKIAQNSVIDLSAEPNGNYHLVLLDADQHAIASKKLLLQK